MISRESRQNSNGCIGIRSTRWTSDFPLAGEAIWSFGPWQVCLTPHYTSNNPKARHFRSLLHDVRNSYKNCRVLMELWSCYLNTSFLSLLFTALFSPYVNYPCNYAGTSILEPPSGAFFPSLLASMTQMLYTLNTDDFHSWYKKKLMTLKEHQNPA